MATEINPYQKLLKIMDEGLSSASDEALTEENLKHLLNEIGQIFSCDRIAFYERQPDESYLKRFEWTSGPSDPSPVSYSADTAAEYHRFWEKSGHEDIVEINDIEKIRSQDPDLYQRLKENGIHSMCFSVLQTDDRIFGFVFFQNPSWNDETAMFTVFHILHEIMKRSLRNIRRLNLAEKKGTTDELTGLGNRMALSLRLETLSHEKSLGLVYADVNGLKEENDSHGHDAGDELLKKTTRILAETFGQENVFRIGGDEFLTISPGISRETFHQKLEYMQEVEQKEAVMIASGSVFEDPWRTDFEVLMRIADSRMYAVKKKWYTDQENRDIQNTLDEDVELALEIFVNQGLYQVLYINAAEKGTFPDYGSLDDLIHTCVEQIIYPDDAAAFQSFCDPVLLKKRALENDAGSAEMQREFRISTAEGTWNWIRMSLIVSNADDNDFRILAISRNLSRYNRTAMKYRRLENEVYDFRNEAAGITPDEELLRKINIWISKNDPAECAFLYFRINHFALYKAIFGNRQTGRLLDQFYENLKEYVGRNNGICGYYGGDEFLAVVPVAVSDEMFVHEISDWIEHLRITEGFMPGCGIAMDRHQETPISDLYDQAMLAQDTIHNSRRHCVQLFSGDEFERVRHEARMLDDLQKDMKNGSMTFYLQPKVNMENGKIVSAEALARWIHNGRIIPPDEYIPLLEQEDRIYPLDRYIWENVFRYQQQLIRKGIRPLPVSVNVSRKDILNGNVAEDFQNLCEKYNMDHHLVNIEITESAYAENDQVRQLSETLSKDGFTVLMDDFGKGYSSLAMFSSMPVDILKIDKKFVDQMMDDQKDAEVVSLIIRMAHMAGIHVVVEGVETEEQVKKMLSMNCHYAQGYYFYKPMPKEEYEKLISKSENVQYDPDASGRLSVGRLDFTELVRSGFIDSEQISHVTGALSIWEIIDRHPVLLQMNEAYEKLMGTSFTSVSPDENFEKYMSVGAEEAADSFQKARKEGSAEVSSGYVRPDTHEKITLCGSIYPMNERLNGDLYLVQMHEEKKAQNH